MEQKQRTRPADEVEEQIEEVKGEVDRERAESLMAESDEVISDIDRILDLVDSDVEAYHEAAKAEYKEKLQGWAKRQAAYEVARAELEEMVEIGVNWLPCGCG